MPASPPPTEAPPPTPVQSVPAPEPPAPAPLVVEQVQVQQVPSVEESVKDVSDVSQFNITVTYLFLIHFKKLNIRNFYNLPFLN